ncbi:MAG: bifunctional adenosylcobinamide kinase/adenosylcobinamide-phosphate guanylyltransferase [Spirochaetaceae bacterium]|nr:bifunctional adenosylcobinamide kinase/adenosylcobinamide-phosphate guanylyltransferase [Spirochaetaceae bacterium]
MITMVTGGVKSGKSSRALMIAKENWTFPAYFIATSEMFDDEMKARIEKHQEERALLAGETGFITIEEPVYIDKTVSALKGCAIIDCLPMWINNIMFYQKENEFAGILENTINYIKYNLDECVIVTNETGLGNIPFDKETRRYNLLLAEANRKFAEMADHVEFMVSGLVMRVK